MGTLDHPPTDRCETYQSRAATRGRPLISSSMEQAAGQAQGRETQRRRPRDPIDGHAMGCGPSGAPCLLPSFAFVSPPPGPGLRSNRLVMFRIRNSDPDRDHVDLIVRSSLSSWDRIPVCPTLPTIYTSRMSVRCHGPTNESMASPGLQLLGHHTVLWYVVTLLRICHIFSKSCKLPLLFPAPLQNY